MDQRNSAQTSSADFGETTTTGLFPPSALGLLVSLSPPLSFQASFGAAGEGSLGANDDDDDNGDDVGDDVDEEFEEG